MTERQLIADLLSALEYHTEQTRPIEFSRVAIQAATEYLRKPEQPAQQEPVCIGYWNQKTGAYYKPDQVSAAHKKLIEDGILRLCYTSPPAQRTWEGLTDEQVAYILGQLPKPPTNDGGALHDWAMQAVRELAAHGITGEKK